jgi:hypothetical protein
MQVELINAVRPVVELLERLRVPYYAGGSLASSLAGVPRSTTDADLVADLEQEHVGPFVETLQADYYVSEPAVRDAVRLRRSFNLIHYATSFKVDIFLPKDRPYDRAALDRPVTAPMPIVEEDSPVELRFASAEDIILAKLEWYRLGNEVSERQWSDVIGVMKVQAERLDREYMRHWAAELGVDDLLEKALDAAGINTPQ